MISVLVSTRNGGDTLGDVLEAMGALEPPAGGWELVVVDNESTDGTPALLARFAERLPLRVLTVSRPGQTRGQNTAVEHARGDLFVFTDDDSMPAPGWLTAYERAAAEHPDHVVFGGPVVPRWEVEPPAWVDECVPPGVQGVAYVRLDPRDDGPFPPRRLHGPNFAVRRPVFDAGLRFDESIGPDGAPDYAMGSETEVLMRLEAQGHDAWFVSDAAVEHHVGAAQLDEDWLMGRAERFGRGQQQWRRRRFTPNPLMPGGLPLRLAGKLARTAVAAGLAGLLGRRRARFVNRWDHHRYRGMARQIRLAGGREAGG